MRRSSSSIWSSRTIPRIGWSSSLKTTRLLTTFWLCLPRQQELAVTVETGLTTSICLLIINLLSHRVLENLYNPSSKPTCPDNHHLTKIYFQGIIRERWALRSHRSLYSLARSLKDKSCSVEQRSHWSHQSHNQRICFKRSPRPFRPRISHLYWSQSLKGKKMFIEICWRTTRRD